MVLAGDSVPAGTTLVTPVLHVLFMELEVFYLKRYFFSCNYLVTLTRLCRKLCQTLV